MSDIIFSVDVETSGPDPGIHQLLSVGAIAYDVAGYEYDTFSCNIFPSQAYLNDRETMAWWKTQPTAWNALQEEQYPLGVAMERFASFIKSQCNTGNAPVFLADPVVFDYPWINWAFKAYGVKNPFHFDSKYGLKTIDLTSFAMGGLGMENTKRHEILNELDVGLPPHTHIAVEDARHQGELFFKIAKKIGWPRT